MKDSLVFLFLHSWNWLGWCVLSDDQDQICKDSFTICVSAFLEVIEDAIGLMVLISHRKIALLFHSFAFMELIGIS